MQLRPAGPDARIIEVANALTAQSLARWIREACPEVAEVVPAAATVLVDGIRDHESLLMALRRWESLGKAGGASSGPLPQITARTITIPVRYVGPDLVDVAHIWGMSVQEAVALHGSIEFQAAFCGFSPGFTYLAGLPPELAVPRLSTPRTRVVAGSVAVADHWCAVYPSPSPGGWRILGTTSAQLWDQANPAPALIAPGARVRFVDDT